MAELKAEFLSVTAVRLHLEHPFNVSEHQIKRAEKSPTQKIVKLVLKGPISITNAAHVIEHVGVGMLHVAWACASEDAPQEFCEQLDCAWRLPASKLNQE